MSVASSKVMPPARHRPFTAHTTGFHTSSPRLSMGSRCVCQYCCTLRSRFVLRKSAPDVNTCRSGGRSGCGAPVTTATQMSGLSRTSIQAFDKSAYIGCVIEFSASGRLITILAMRSVTSKSIPTVYSFTGT